MVPAESQPAARSGQDEFTSLLYNELRHICAVQMGMEAPGHTLQPTAVVHEVFLRLCGGKTLTWNDRAHFLACAAGCVRRVLVDHARGRRRQKRGGGLQRVSCDDADPGVRGPDLEILALHEALEELGRLNPRHAQVVEMRYFAGMSEVEIAEVLGVSDRTVRADWGKARTWLNARLSDGERHDGG